MRCRSGSTARFTSPISTSRLASLRRLSGKDVCRILQEHGFQEVRRRGSHIVMQRRDSEGSRTIPVPDHDELRTGTLLSIVRQSQLPRALFEHH
ncbi:MAG: type II toxin-antitoxin system HicA family toxin [Candidatus Dormibacteria bacterium]